MNILLSNFRQAIWGERDDLRAVYIVAALIIACVMIFLISIDETFGVNTWPDESLLLVYGGAAVILLAGFFAGVFRVGLLASWAISVTPVFTLFTLILLEGMVESDPTLFSVLPTSIVASFSGGIVIGSLTYAIGRAIRLFCMEG